MTHQWIVHNFLSEKRLTKKKHAAKKKGNEVEMVDQ